jgi:PncC family amidohydrolase
MIPSALGAGRRPTGAAEIEFAKTMRAGGWKLVVAESCTGGLISHRLTNLPGASEYLLAGLTTYANEAKEQLLGVRAETLTLYGAVSRETALEMARGARNLFSHRFPEERLLGLAVTGIAGPTGGSPEKPVGTVWIGLAGPQREGARLLRLKGTRRQIKEASATAALVFALDALGVRPGEPARAT